MANSETEELLDVLAAAREAAHFLRELGVNSVERSTPTETPMAASAVASTETTAPAISKSPRSAARLPAPVPAHSAAAALSDSLFENAQAAAARPAVSRESIEDIWRDIGDC